jgi:hypothetical protein
MDDAQRQAVWPKTNQLGGYSYVLHKRQDRDALWNYLLNTLQLDTCSALSSAV